MNARTTTFYICLIGIVGGSAAIVNSLCPGNSTALVGIVAMTASMALFISLLADVATLNIVNAVVNKDRADQVSLLTGVIGKTLYKVIEEEKTKKE
jgi:hypothetical protein